MYSTIPIPKCSSRIVCSPAAAAPSSATSASCGTATCHCTDPSTRSSRASACNPAARAAAAAPRDDVARFRWQCHYYARPGRRTEQAPLVLRAADPPHHLQHRVAHAPSVAARAWPLIA